MIRFLANLASYIIVLVAVTLAAGAFSPFRLGDAIGGEQPTIAGTLVWLVPLECLLLWIAHMLQKAGRKTRDA